MKTIEQQLAELAAQVPKEEWDKLPFDLNENLDHYLYGLPKKRYSTDVEAALIRDLGPHRILATGKDIRALKK